MPGPATVTPSNFYGAKPTFNGVPRGHPLAGLASSAILGSPQTGDTSASSSSFGGATRPGLGQFQSQTPSGSFPRKRSASPELAERTDSRPNKMQRPAAPTGLLGQGSSSFARIKSESDIEGQFGGSSVPIGQQRQSSGQDQYRRDDTPGLVGRVYMREQLTKHLPDKAVIPEDVLTYLSTATETYLRTVIRSSLSASVHRTCTSHTRQPPFAYPSDESSPSGEPSQKGIKRTKLSYDDSRPDGKPLWSHTITSDPSPVIAALSKANRQAEQAFRVQRMDRIAREQDERAHMPVPMQGYDQAGAAAGASGSGGIVNGDAVSASSAGDRDLTEGRRDSGPVPPGTPAPPGVAPSLGSDTAPSPSTPAPATPLPPAPLNATPTFGATPIPSSKKTGKKYQAKSSMSSETQLRMSNATAARAAGLSSKKYSWMSSAPNLSSPLSGKKGKKAALAKSKLGEQSKDGDEEDAEGEAEESAASDAEGGKEGASGGKANGASLGVGAGTTFGGGLFGGTNTKTKRKSKLSQSTLGVAPDKERKVPISRPTRRLVSIVRDPDALPSFAPKAEGAISSPITTTFSKPAQFSTTATSADTDKVPDDRAITFADVIFALKRDTTGIDAQGVMRRMNERKWAKERKEEAAAAGEKERGGALAGVSGTGAGTGIGAGGSGIPGQGTSGAW